MTVLPKPDQCYQNPTSVTKTRPVLPKPNQCYQNPTSVTNETQPVIKIGRLNRASRLHLITTLTYVV